MDMKVEDLLSYADFIDFAKYAISRLDGAYARVIAAKYGIDDAGQCDTEAWEDWLERIAKVLKKKLHHEGHGFESVQDDLPKYGIVIGTILGLWGDSEFFPDGTIVVRLTQCELWEGIKKAGFAQAAKAGIFCANVHKAAYKGLLKGLYPDLKFELSPSKRIPDGDPCCDIVIKPRPKRQK